MISYKIQVTRSKTQETRSKKQVTRHKFQVVAGYLFLQHENEMELDRIVWVVTAHPVILHAAVTKES